MKCKIPEALIERVYQGKSTKEDALLLLEIPSLELFRFADELRSFSVGDTVTYVVNRNINFASRCLGTCGFCAFKDKNGYILGLEEIMAKVREAKQANATEVCIQGGLLPDVGLDFYLGIVEAIKAEYPEMHIHSFSPMEIYHAAHTSGISVKEALFRLKKSGLDTMPGTASRNTFGQGAGNNMSCKTEDRGMGRGGQAGACSRNSYHRNHDVRTY